eukprot:COSAG01_NODE_21200_length_913_cov_1.584767_2_plen_171_part_00
MRLTEQATPPGLPSLHACQTTRAPIHYLCPYHVDYTQQTRSCKPCLVRCGLADEGDGQRFGMMFEDVLPAEQQRTRALLRFLGQFAACIMSCQTTVQLVLCPSCLRPGIPLLASAGMREHIDEMRNHPKFKGSRGPPLKKMPGDVMLFMRSHILLRVRAPPSTHCRDCIY